MAYLAVSKSKAEFVFKRKPYRVSAHWTDEEFGYIEQLHATVRGYCTDRIVTVSKPCSGINLPKGTIEKILRRKLTWKDEPVKINESYGK